MTWVVEHRRARPTRSPRSALSPRLGVGTLLVWIGTLFGSLPQTISAQTGSYQGLTRLFTEWRAFERPAMRNGAPDYTAATMARKHAALKDWFTRLSAIDTTGWTTDQQIDWHLVRAEMNGLDFYIRVLKPWERDPAYYVTVWPDQSDTPDHEGPTNHAAIELW
ncbi:MAG TPA: hypothetical protein VFZ73_00345, partial [Gemmatimonadaceae bacterium]